MILNDNSFCLKINSIIKTKHNLQFMDVSSFVQKSPDDDAL